MAHPRNSRVSLSGRRSGVAAPRLPIAGGAWLMTILLSLGLLLACGSPLSTPPVEVTTAPTLTPTATEGSALVVTLADGGKTIDLRVGERFLLELGEGYDWTVTVTDPAIVSRVVTVTVVRGAQGLYEAHMAGSTTLTAVGDPVCRKAQPPCEAPSRLLEIEITVAE